MVTQTQSGTKAGSITPVSRLPLSHMVKSQAENVEANGGVRQKAMKDENRALLAITARRGFVGSEIPRLAIV